MSKSNKQRIVVVLGMHRSGTSAYTHALEVLGFDLGVGLCAPNEWNRKGQFEHPEINQLNDEILSHVGMSWDSVSCFKIDIVDPEIRKFRTRALQILEGKFKNGGPRALKDPRIARLVSFWNDVLVEAGFDVRYLLVIRNPLEVAHSLNRRDHFSILKGCWLWARYIVSVLEWLENSCNENICVLADFDRLIQDADRQLRNLAARLDSPLSMRELDTVVADYCAVFIDGSLKNELLIPNSDMESHGVPRQVAMLYREIQKLSTRSWAPLKEQCSRLLKRLSTDRKSVV